MSYPGVYTTTDAVKALLRSDATIQSVMLRIGSTPDAITTEDGFCERVRDAERDLTNRLAAVYATKVHATVTGEYLIDLSAATGISVQLCELLARKLAAVGVWEYATQSASVEMPWIIGAWKKEVTLTLDRILNGEIVLPGVPFRVSPAAMSYTTRTPVYPYVRGPEFPLTSDEAHSTVGE
jgi:hypothetical protein